MLIRRALILLIDDDTSIDQDANISSKNLSTNFDEY